jgi:hypothetical protein
VATALMHFGQLVDELEAVLGGHSQAR